MVLMYMAGYNGLYTAVLLQNCIELLLVINLLAIDPGRVDRHRRMVHSHQHRPTRQLLQPLLRQLQLSIREVAAGTVGPGAVQQQYAPTTDLKGSLVGVVLKVGFHSFETVVIAGQPDCLFIGTGQCPV